MKRLRNEEDNPNIYLKGKRLVYVDIMKSIGIILMIIGHIGPGYYVDFYIHSFHMPLFFIMSGYLYKDKKIRFCQYSLMKGRTLIVPYFVVGLFHYIIYIVSDPQGDMISPLIHLLFDNSDNLPITGALWFLTALFFAYQLMFLVRMIESEIVQMGVTVGIVTLGYFVSKIIILPWSLGPALVCFGFMQCGQLIREKYKSFINNSMFCVLYISLGFIVATLNDYVNVRVSKYGNIIMFYTAAILIVFGLQGLIERFVDFDSRIIEELQFIGINSLVYMCFNQIVVWLPNKIISQYNGPIVLYLKVAELIITLIILRIVAMFLSKSKIWNKITGRTL